MSGEILTAPDLDALRAGLRVLGWRDDLANARTEIVRERLAKVPALVEGLRQARTGSLHDIRRAAFAPKIGVRYTEAIRLDIADQCRRLENSIDATLDAWFKP